MKIRPAVAELVHGDGRTDGRTDMTKLLVDFRNFANAPKKPDSFKQGLLSPCYTLKIHSALWQHCAAATSS